jgi:hypothetical protein
VVEKLTLSWIELTPDLQVGQHGDRIAALLYAVVAQAEGRMEWLEFCCLLTGPPAHQEEAPISSPDGDAAQISAREVGRDDFALAGFPHVRRDITGFIPHARGVSRVHARQFALSVLIRVRTRYARATTVRRLTTQVKSCDRRLEAPAG